MSKPLLTLAVLLACASAAGAQTSAESIDLVLPGARQRLRIEVTFASAAPTARWHAFLDRWFDYFDTDGDGTLSPPEAARLFALPLPQGKSASFDFAKADLDKDGKVTRAELKAFYRRAGFTPVLAVVEPVSMQNQQLAETLFFHLGPDAKGKLSLERFKQAATILRRLDENEDEVLTPAEVLSLSARQANRSPQASDFTWQQADGKSAEAAIAIGLDGAPAPTIRVERVGKSVERISADAAMTNVRFRFERAILAFSLADASPAKAVVTSRQFVLAQFRSVADKNLSIAKSHIEDDASLQLLADIFAHADRNQDGKLTLGELERFLDLIEAGVNCPDLLTLTDHGRNLFLHLDANADGRLDLRELNAAAKLVSALGGAKGWTRSDVPPCALIHLQRGFAASAFGPLPLAAGGARVEAKGKKSSAKGPAWFQAMDKNGDGFVSPREFLGPIELFRRLDRDGDGLISVAEAEQAGTVASQSGGK